MYRTFGLNFIVLEMISLKTSEPVNKKVEPHPKSPKLQFRAFFVRPIKRDASIKSGM